MNKLKTILVTFLFIFISLLPQVSVAGPCSLNDCPASVGNEIAAAWATEGYYFHADMIRQLEETDLGLWAPLLYICSVLGFLVMMAMGQPPRNYLWFALGPAIFNWILFTKEDVKGVAWRMAGVDADQEIVWKLSHTGLINSNYLNAKCGGNASKTSGPGCNAEVSMFFLWADKVVSSAVEGLSGITGFNVRKQGGGDTDTHEKPSDPERHQEWAVLSNSKWPMLENITMASIFSNDLRSAFVHFMGSECGDLLSSSIDEGKYIQSMQKKTEIPQDLFADIEKFKKDLAGTKIPIPRHVYNLFAEKSLSGSTNTFRQFNSNISSSPKDPSEWRHIDCGAYLYALIQGMRWEAGGAYNQFVQEAASHKIKEEAVVYNFLYGWDIGKKLSMPEQKDFIKDMILLHVFKNELAMTPTMNSVRWSSSEKSVNYTQAYHRKIGSKNKYGELYTWAKMMPYLQGLLLYIISAAYPFCCIMVVIPGWHKIMFTWLGFFAWAKSWDFGFAIVMTVERSLWAMIGNSTESHKVFERVYNLQKLGQVKVDCVSGRDSATGFCALPEVTDAGNQSYDNALKLLSEFLALAGSLEFDLGNAYYIYLMSALYFAVPAVTGQILLGAKAGAASIATGMVSGPAQEGAKTAGGAYTSELQSTMNGNQGVMRRAAQGKALRNGPTGDLFAASQDAAFQQQRLSAQEKGLGTQSSHLGRSAEAAGMAQEQYQQNSTNSQVALGHAGTALAQFLRAMSGFQAVADSFLGGGGGNTPGTPGGAGQVGLTRPSASSPLVGPGTSGASGEGAAPAGRSGGGAPASGGSPQTGGRGANPVPTSRGEAAYNQAHSRQSQAAADQAGTAGQGSSAPTQGNQPASSRATGAGAQGSPLATVRSATGTADSSSSTAAGTSQSQSGMSQAGRQAAVAVDSRSGVASGGSSPRASSSPAQLSSSAKESVWNTIGTVAGTVGMMGGFRGGLAIAAMSSGRSVAPISTMDTSAGSTSGARSSNPYGRAVSGSHTAAVERPNGPALQYRAMGSGR